MRSRLAVVVVDTFRSCRQRNYRLWVIGQGVSQVGYFAQIVAMALLVLDLTGSGEVLGLVVSLSFVPNLAFGAWAGLLSDRLDKRKMLAVTESTRMACSLCLGTLIWSGCINLTWVLALAGLSGIAYASDQPAGARSSRNWYKRPMLLTRSASTAP